MPATSHAFVEGPRAVVAGAPEGPLAGLTFGAKDLFDVAGQVTRGGNPDWARLQRPADATAWAILRLTDFGATLAGKTVTDELACGLFGANPHDGTPPNPLSPDRVPGGSSAGSASAVAAGLVDFALGTDTGGSVRVPSSFCGVFGIRPTHGAVPLAGCLALAPSFDTCGWFARDAETLARVGDVLLPPAADPVPGRLLVAADLVERCAPAVRSVLEAAARALGATPVAACSGDPFDHPDTFWPLMGRQMWNTFGAWYRRERPRLGPGNGARFEAAAAIGAAEVRAAEARRRRIAAHLLGLVGACDLLLLPTVHDVAPRRDAPLGALELFRRHAHVHLALAGLSGCPQVSVPLRTSDGLGAGLSLVAPRGRDRLLLAAATDAAARLGAAGFDPGGEPSRHRG